MSCPSTRMLRLWSARRRRRRVRRGNIAAAAGGGLRTARDNCKLRPRPRRSLRIVRQTADEHLPRRKLRFQLRRRGAFAASRVGPAGLLPRRTVLLAIPPKQCLHPLAIGRQEQLSVGIECREHRQRAPGQMLQKLVDFSPRACGRTLPRAFCDGAARSGSRQSPQELQHDEHLPLGGDQ